MPSRRLVVSGCAALLVVIWFGLTSSVLDHGKWSLLRPHVDLPSEHSFKLYDDNSACLQTKPPDPETPSIVNNTSILSHITRRNIAVASVFPHHFDVYMTVVWTLQRVLAQVPDSQIHVFAAPFNYGFQSLVDRLGLHHGSRNHPNELVSFLDSEEGRRIDVLVLGTCEIECVSHASPRACHLTLLSLRTWHTQLLSAWDTRPASQKFQLVCIVHNVKDTNWQIHITDWARRGAIQLLTIAEQYAYSLTYCCIVLIMSVSVKASFRRVFNQHADSANRTLYTAGYEHIPIDVHVPILDLPGLPVKDQNRILSKVVIQGTFDVGRRDYPNFFADLVRSLHGKLA